VDDVRSKEMKPKRRDRRVLNRGVFLGYTGMPAIATDIRPTPIIMTPSLNEDDRTPADASSARNVSVVKELRESVCAASAQLLSQ
jgi:hypothetical protein